MATKIFNKKKQKRIRKLLRKNLGLPEVILWNHLKNRQMLGYKFRRQYSVDKYVIDFYCPKLKLALELDGSSHDLDESILEYDLKRQKFIEQYGIRFLRINNYDVLYNLDDVLEYIKQFIKNIEKVS